MTKLLENWRESGEGTSKEVKADAESIVTTIFSESSRGSPRDLLQEMTSLESKTLKRLSSIWEESFDEATTLKGEFFDNNITYSYLYRAVHLQKLLAMKMMVAPLQHCAWMRIIHSIHPIWNAHFVFEFSGNL
jgi:hypothetical protein